MYGYYVKRLIVIAMLIPSSCRHSRVVSVGSTSLVRSPILPGR